MRRYGPDMGDDATVDIDWRGDRAQRWLAQAAQLERQLEPVSEVLFAAAAPAPGEHVLDVGCGTGPTTRQAGRAVTPGGSATGLDVSPPLLAHAAAVSGPGDGELRWIEADAVGWEPDRAYDLVLSRFGVMFFSDPAAAFATLARATRPAGRLAVAVWSHRSASPLFEVPYAAALAAVRAAGAEPVPMPEDQGPFSLHDREATTALLTDAGWGDVGWAEHDLPLLLAGGVGPDEAAEECMGFGPSSTILAEADDEVRAAARAAMAEALAGHVDADGHVVLDGRVVIVTART